MSFLTQLAANPVFAGGTGVALTGGVLWLARELPHALWRAVERQFSVSLVIDNADDLFDRLSIYLSRSPAVERARWLRMAELYDYAAQRWCWRPTFGLGFHIIRDRGDLFFIWRALDEKDGGLSLVRRETITLRTWGKSQRAIRQLMERADQVYQDQEGVRVHVWAKGGWVLADLKPLRPFATIFLPAEQKARLLADHDRWEASREAYRARGTPWRRGYLLKGPPGTGKTSIALALASHARRPLYAINLAAAGGDLGLLAAFNSAEPGALILLEDVDAARIAHDRGAGLGGGVESKDEPDKHVTLSGLLNVIDGLPARENRVLVMTSNHADRLDPALIRAGRVDLVEEIGPLDGADAWAMVESYAPGAQAWFERVIAPRLPISGADLQGELLALGGAA